MTIHVLGASGFIGKAIAKTAANRDDIKYYSSKPIKKEGWQEFNIFEYERFQKIKFSSKDTIIFLSWPNLPNYHEKFHIQTNLLSSMNFLNMVHKKGVSKIIVAGTCYEYGLQNGMLKENMNTLRVS